jgi:hypothetical protein
MRCGETRIPARTRNIALSPAQVGSGRHAALDPLFIMAGHGTAEGQ